MKLSKDEFGEILMEAAHHTANIRGGRCVEIHDAFIENTLEIEGYERVEWIKFDPTNPKTFPPEDKMFLAFGSPDINVNYDDHEFVCWRNSVFSYSTNESGTPEIKYWRPLPPPPGKEEGK